MGEVVKFTSKADLEEEDSINKQEWLEGNLTLLSLEIVGYTWGIEEYKSKLKNAQANYDALTLFWKDNPQEQLFTIEEMIECEKAGDFY